MHQPGKFFWRSIDFSRHQYDAQDQWVARLHNWCNQSAQAENGIKTRGSKASFPWQKFQPKGLCWRCTSAMPVLCRRPWSPVRRCATLRCLSSWCPSRSQTWTNTVLHVDGVVQSYVDGCNDTMVAMIARKCRYSQKSRVDIMCAPFSSVLIKFLCFCNYLIGQVQTVVLSFEVLFLGKLFICRFSREGGENKGETKGTDSVN